MKYTREGWETEGQRLFGPSMWDRKFKCPSCGHVATAREWIEAGAPRGAIAFSCIGRWRDEPVKDAFHDEGDGPCNYTGGGLIGINPVTVEDMPGEWFAFAEEGLEGRDEH